MWGHYARGHTGICLIFRTILNETNVPYLSLENSKLLFYKVKYGKQFPRLNFFERIGKFPIPVLNKNWYCDDGNISLAANELLNDANEWRQKYWENFYAIANFKLADWEYEEEYRLICYSTFPEQERGKGMKLKYDFNQLDGIIFGINTSIESKQRIMEIIQKKCQLYKRMDFKFYQASCCTQSGRINRREISLLPR